MGATKQRTRNKLSFLRYTRLTALHLIIYSLMQFSLRMDLGYKAYKKMVC